MRNAILPFIAIISFLTCASANAQYIGQVRCARSDQNCSEGTSGGSSAALSRGTTEDRTCTEDGGVMAGDTTGAAGNIGKIDKSKGDIVKKGLSFGPVPYGSYSADYGWLAGLMLNVYNFGDGSTYPTPKSTLKFIGSYFTGGRKYLLLTYDDLYLIPGVRLSTGVLATFDSKLDFYGFNGSQSVLDMSYFKRIDNAVNPNRRFYFMVRTVPAFKADFIGHITKTLYWEAGYHFSYTDARDYLAKGETEVGQDVSLFGLYKAWGIIPKEIATGGISSEIRAGLVYDTRNSENNPTHGIWAESFFTAAPKFIGSSVGYSKVDAIWRQYIPFVKDKLIFAYRVSYAQFLGQNAPWYATPYFYVVGPNFDRDGIGSYRTVRGMASARLQGRGVGFYNAELRYIFVNFKLLKQNWAFAVSAFNDGARVFVPYEMQNYTGLYLEQYAKYVNTSSPDSFHFTVGGGLRLIMNHNFVVTCELGHSLNSQDSEKVVTVDLNTDWIF
jgi:hypothetical protein